MSGLGEDERRDFSPVGLEEASSSDVVLGLTADRAVLPSSGSGGTGGPSAKESAYARRPAEQIARDWAESRYPGRPVTVTETRRAKVKKLADALEEQGVNLDDAVKTDPLRRVRRIQ